VHSTTFSLATEKLAGVEAPPRAQAIRTLMLELERIHSHLLWLGVAAHEGGFDTLFMYSWRDRETVMDLLESVSGNRVNYSSNILGGVKFDINAEQAASMRKGLEFLEERSKYYLNVVTTDETFLGRTRNVGTMTQTQADELGAVGPTARASGVPRDMRAEMSYLIYDQLPLKVVTETAGDLEARFVVRINEVVESIHLIRAILDNLPEGELSVRVPRRIPEGEIILRSEAPRGELFYYVRSNGTDMPDRVKIRTPSLCNWGTITSVAVGHKLADMPMLLAGIDPCFSCNDRMVSVNRSDKAQVWTWDDLRRYGIEYYK
jgi:NADH-quinone oxidoreductase subunit D